MMAAGETPNAIVLTLPPLPVLEILLVIVVILLCRLLVKLDHGLVLFREVRETLQQLQQQQQQGGSVKGGNLVSSPYARAASPHATRRRLDAPASPEDFSLAPPPVERLMGDSAQQFAECLLDEKDIDVARFIKACRHFTRVLEKIGPFTMLSVRETHSNLTKIEQTFLLDPTRFQSMYTMLEEEVSSRMHSPGGHLADPSAAIGLLWARRGLSFWISLFRPHVEEYLREHQHKHASTDVLSLPEDGEVAEAFASAPAASLSASGGGSRSSANSRAASRSASPPSWVSQADGLFGEGAAQKVAAGAAVAAGISERLSSAGTQLLSGVVSPQGYAEFLRAYEETIAPFNGWIARNTFTLTARASPDWKTFGLKVAPNLEALGEDVHLWSTAVKACTVRMQRMHTELDLEDMRKTI